ncbi:MAG: DUF2752 domain-containing protein [Flavobacteriaceae bacterium]|nr:MAG: DUF2752 domain-containing protein [Flavobacteriaceae bacterium]
MSRTIKLSIGILLLIIVSLYFFFDPDSIRFFPECPFYKMTNLYCPGCGSQRAIHDLTHLNIMGAIRHNILMVVTLFFGFGLFLYSKNRFYKLIYHPKSPYIIFGIIVLFWILRNLNIFPFHILAPITDYKVFWLPIQ